MRQLLRRLWQDDGGALIATEWLFIVVIMVIGLITGFVFVRDAVVDELAEVGNAIHFLDPSYSFDGLTYCDAFTHGSHTTKDFHKNTVTHTPAEPHDVTVNICETF
jgi:Flp pilus assembly pilin Flp